MTHDNLLKQIDSLISGDISNEEHDSLQARLKSDADARAVFRERMDMEAGLRTWAAETPAVVALASRSDGPGQRAPRQLAFRFDRIVYVAVATIAAALLVMIGLNWAGLLGGSPTPVVKIAPDDDSPGTQLVQHLGTLSQQDQCEWVSPPILSGAKFLAGAYSLASGVAQLSFESGTDVILEGPCELVVLDGDSARLVNGNVFVNVTELSNGFVLETPESRVIDQGTEFAVSIDEESTEVHVFDGSVIWQPNRIDSTSEVTTSEERIEAGEARRFLRERPATPTRIPFGQRQFVRHIETQLKEHSGDSLLAYDGFENLAGQLRRDRSGFGWSGGWTSGGRGRGKLGDVIDAPEDEVFGIKRSGRRMLLLSNGDDIRRQFEQPIDLQTDNSLFVSFLAMRTIGSGELAGRSLQISLEPALEGQDRRREPGLSFGFTTQGFPFNNSNNSVSEIASPIRDDEICFCVMKLSADKDGIHPFLRVYRSGEQLDTGEPVIWTVTGKSAGKKFKSESIRLIVGPSTSWQFDELKIGSTWQSVLPAR